MVKFKNIMLIAVIGITVLISGCTGNQESKIAEPTKPTPVEQTSVGQTPTGTPAGQTPPYQIQINEIKSLQDCIVYAGTKQPCSIVNLEIKNNNIKSLSVKIVKNEIVLKGGNSIEMYDREAGLSNLCVRLEGMDYKLTGNTNQNVGMCYPVVHKSDGPTLNMAAMINGERKEYTFDLIKYGLTD